MAPTKQIIATLVRGNTYSLKNSNGGHTRFSKGVGAPVTADQKALLEAVATDLVTQQDDDGHRFGQQRAKFKFEEA